MKLSDIINESFLLGGRAPLYHFTEMLAAISIVEMDTLASNVRYADIARLSDPRPIPGRISLTRDKKYRVRGNSTGVAFELDHDKLTTRFRIQPYADGFVRNNRPDNLGGRREEAEEYIDGMLRPLESYLTAIHIAPKDYEDLQRGIDAFEHWRDLDVDTRKYNHYEPARRAQAVLRALEGQRKARREYQKQINRYNGLLQHSKLKVGLP